MLYPPAGPLPGICRIFAVEIVVSGGKGSKYPFAGRDVQIAILAEVQVAGIVIPTLVTMPSRTISDAGSMVSPAMVNRETRLRRPDEPGRSG